MSTGFWKCRRTINMSCSVLHCSSSHSFVGRMQLSSERHSIHRSQRRNHRYQVRETRQQRPMSLGERYRATTENVSPFIAFERVHR